MRMKESSGFVMFGAAMLLSILAFEYRANLRTMFGEQDVSLLLAPYGCAVLTAAAFGAYLSRWYDDASGIFEVLSVPVVVGALSVFVAGQVFSFMSRNYESGPHMSFLETVAAGVYSSAAFVFVTWPVLTFAFVASSILVRYVSHKSEVAHAV